MYANLSLQHWPVHSVCRLCEPGQDGPMCCFSDHLVLHVRYPAGCEVGTVYDAAVGACVACPAGLQTLGTVGGDCLGMCVPAGTGAASESKAFQSKMAELVKALGQRGRENPLNPV